LSKYNAAVRYQELYAVV